MDRQMIMSKELLKKSDQLWQSKRYSTNAGHRQGVGTVSKTATGKFDSYGLRQG